MNGHTVSNILITLVLLIKMLQINNPIRATNVSKIVVQIYMERKFENFGRYMKQLGLIS